MKKITGILTPEQQEKMKEKMAPRAGKQGKKKEADVMMNLTSVRRGVSEDGLALVPSAGEKINLFDHPDISIDELKAIEANSL